MHRALIFQFLSLRGTPFPRAIHRFSHRISRSQRRCASDNSKQRVLEKPDKFRPPSHPARRVVQTRNGKVVNYPGPRLTEQERKERATKQYPHMFPPKGTLMYKFLTNRGIHVWIAFGVMTSLATFTFTTRFKTTSPFAHLLPPWSGLLYNPIETLSQAIDVYKMDVRHNTIRAEEQRLERFGDAYKRHQFRVAHGMKEAPEIGPDANVFEDRDRKNIAALDAGEKKEESLAQDEYMDFNGETKRVKKWFGIW